MLIFLRYLIFKLFLCFFFLPVHHSSALCSTKENTIDSFYCNELPLAEAYLIHKQTTGFLKCLGRIRMVIVHILVITTFLTFIRCLLHMSKLRPAVLHQCGT